MDRIDELLETIVGQKERAIYHRRAALDSAHSDRAQHDAEYNAACYNISKARQQIAAEYRAMYEALEKAVRVMNTFGNITNWPEEMPQEYAEAINEGRTALAAARGES